MFSTKIKRMLWKLICVNRKRVTFISFNGSSYSDNPRAISEALKQIDEKVEIVWIRAGNSKLMGAPDYIKVIDREHSLIYWFYLASSRVIVTNFRFPNIPKKHSQMYIQTWHGDRAFKKVLYDSQFVDRLELLEAKDGYCDLAIAGSDYGEKQYRSAFHYTGTVLKVGTPRDDKLVNISEQLIFEKRRELGLDPDAKYLLYAPTLRRKNQDEKTKQNIQGIDLVKTLSVLEGQYGGKWVCLMRSHPGVNGLTGINTNENLIKDMSGWPDMSDLLIISDVLITDYSSCAGDFALAKRPIFLFQDDIEDYQKNDRSFYFKMSDSPYLIAHTQDELNALIALTSKESAIENCNDILRFYGTIETGHSSECVAKRIMEFCGKS